MSEDIVFLPVRKLAALIRTRQVSPVEVASTFLDRLDTLGPHYNAVVTVTRDRALAQAKRAEAEIAGRRYRGLLHGIPYGAKDLLATSEGIPTNVGCRSLQTPGLRLRRHSGPEARRRRGGVGSEAGHGRAGWRYGVQERGRIVHRAGNQSLEYNDLVRWFFERARLSSSRWPRPIRHRFGDMGVNTLPIRLLWPLGPEAHVRPGQPPRRHGSKLDAR